MNKQRIGSVNLKTTQGVSSFDVLSDSKGDSDYQDGYLVLGGVPAIRVSMYRGAFSDENNAEKCQFVYDSLIKSGQEYNALPLIGVAWDAKSVINKFNVEMLNYSNVEFRKIFGRHFCLVESNEGAPKQFRFNIWDRGLMEAIYTAKVKPNYGSVELTLDQYLVRKFLAPSIKNSDGLGVAPFEYIRVPENDLDHPDTVKEIMLWCGVQESDLEQEMFYHTEGDSYCAGSYPLHQVNGQYLIRTNDGEIHVITSSLMALLLKGY